MSLFFVVCRWYEKLEINVVKSDDVKTRLFLANCHVLIPSSHFIKETKSYSI